MSGGEQCAEYSKDDELNRSIVACIAGTLVLRTAASSMAIMLGFYLSFINRNQYPVSATIVGLLAASFFLTELIGAPVFGSLSDTWGRKLFIILGPIFGAVAVQLNSMTTVLAIILVTRLLEGLSTASSTS